MIARLRAHARQLVSILRNRRAFEQDVDAELEFHLQSRADQLQSASVSRAEALRQARIELGMLESHRDAIRRVRGLGWIDQLSADLRLAWRSLRKSPLYSLTAVAVLALPLTTALLLHGLYAAYALHSPNLDRVDRWVHLYGDSVDDRRDAHFSASEAEQLLATELVGVEGLYSSRVLGLPLVSDRVQRGIGVAVSANYFALTGVPALRGRVFDPGAGDNVSTVVLSDRGWERLFGRSEDALGQVVSIGGQPFEVLGIAGRQFRGSNEVSAHYWMLESDYRQHWPDASADLRSHEVSGFIEPGAQATAISGALQHLVDRFNQQRDEDQALHAVGVEAAHGYLRADDRKVLKIALTPVAMLVLLMLIIAAANLTNLVLARFSARRHDMALRAALGASRLRMFAQLLTECGLQGIAAALTALLLLTLLLQPLHGLLFSFLAELGLDPIEIGLSLSSVAVAFALALLATVVFGALPAWLVTRAWSAHRPSSAAQDALKQAGTGRLRSALMVAQLAASVFLVIVAAMISGVASDSEQAPLGYDPQQLVSIDAGGDPVALRQTLLRSPLVRSVAGTSTAPLMGESERRGVLVDGRSATVQVRYVDPQWFAMLGQEPLRGRLLTSSEGLHSRSAVLSRTAAQALWPEQDPLGKTLSLAPESDREDNRQPLAGDALEGVEVVGIVPDIATGFLLRSQEQPVIYLPAQVGDAPLQTLLLRLTDTSPEALAVLYRRCNAAQPQSSCRPQLLTEALRIQQLPLQIASRIGAALGWIAMGISCLGLYGLVSYAVVQRRRELGVRLALGAKPSRVVAEVMRGATMLIAVGVALGLPMAYLLTRLIATLTDVFDLLSANAFVYAPALLAIIAVTAAWLPARRSSQIAPSEALRHER